MIDESLKSSFVSELQSLIERIVQSSGISAESVTDIIEQMFASDGQAADKTDVTHLVTPRGAYIAANALLNLNIGSAPTDLNSIAKLATAIGSSDAISTLADALSGKLDATTFTGFLTDLEQDLLDVVMQARGRIDFTVAPYNALLSSKPSEWSAVTKGTYMGIVDITKLNLVLSADWSGTTAAKNFPAKIELMTDPVTGYALIVYTVDVAGIQYVASVINYPHLVKSEYVWRANVPGADLPLMPSEMVDMLAAVQAVGAGNNNTQPYILAAGRIDMVNMTPSNANSGMCFNIVIDDLPESGGYKLYTGYGAGAIGNNFVSGTGYAHILNSGGVAEEGTYTGGSLTELEWKITAIDSTVNLSGIVAGTWTPAGKIAISIPPKTDRWDKPSVLTEHSGVKLELRNKVSGLTTTHIVGMVNTVHRALPVVPYASGDRVGIFDGRLSTPTLQKAYGYAAGRMVVKYGRENVVDNGEIQLHLDVVRNPDIAQAVMDKGNFITPIKAPGVPDEYRLNHGWILSFGVANNRGSGVTDLSAHYLFDLEVEWIDNGMRKFRMVKSAGTNWRLHEIDVNGNVASVADVNAGTILDNDYVSAIMGYCTALDYTGSSASGFPYLFPTIPFQTAVFNHPTDNSISYDVAQGQFLITLSATPKDSASGRKPCSRTIKLFSF